MRWKEMKNYKFISKTVYFPNEKILAIGDLHLGYEEELNAIGIAVPKRQLEETMRELKDIFKSIPKIEKIVILGDVRHSFAKIRKQEIETMKKFFDFLNRSYNEAKIIVIKGNHDTMLNILFQKEKWERVDVVDYFSEDRMLFFHGDIESFKRLNREIKKAKIIVVGHFHSAIDITDGEKVERFKCFLVGKLRNREIIFVPSFFPFVEGMNILSKSEIDYYPIKEKRVFVISPEGEILDFGKIIDRKFGG